MYSGFLIGLAAGLAATVHCVGMCGGFPLHLSHGAKGAALLPRQLLYVIGKLFTYAFLGAVFGALGSTLTSGILPQSQKTLAILAGGVIILFGLGMAGVRLPSGLSHRFNAYEWGFVRSLYAHFFAQPGPWASFTLGMATGFLPCPITLAMLAVATASHSVLQGILVMAGLGVGTAPGLLAAGLFGSVISARWRRVGLRPAAVIVILLGTVTILRTQDFMHRGCHEAGAHPAVTCSHCRTLGHTCPCCAAKTKPTMEHH